MKSGAFVLLSLFCTREHYFVFVHTFTGFHTYSLSHSLLRTRRFLFGPWICRLGQFWQITKMSVSIYILSPVANIKKMVLKNTFYKQMIYINFPVKVCFTSLFVGSLFHWTNVFISFCEKFVCISQYWMLEPLFTP